jgi:hypothetical protein
VQRLQTHPGVGALTALAFVLIIGRAEAVSVWQADRELSVTGAASIFTWRCDEDGRSRSNPPRQHGIVPGSRANLTLPIT